MQINNITNREKYAKCQIFIFIHLLSYQKRIKNNIKGVISSTTHSLEINISYSLSHLVYFRELAKFCKLLIEQTSQFPYF